MTSSSDKTNTHSRFQTLQAEYLKSLRSRVDRIQELSQNLKPDDFRLDSLREIHQLARSICSSASAFNVTDLGNISKRIGKLISPHLDTDAIENPCVLVAPLNELADQLAETANYIFESTILQLDPQFTESGPPAIKERIVSIIDGDRHYAEMLARVINARGYKTCLFEDTTQFAKHYSQKEAPVVVVSDISFSENDKTGNNTKAELKKIWTHDVPLIMLSVKDDMNTRLMALRAGADRFLTKPVDHSKLLNILDELVKKEQQEKYRVLIIDDDEKMLSYYQILFDQVGIDVYTLSDPMQAWDLMIKTRPDVIITDGYMSQCNGPELAAILREHDDYKHIPILFLSCEQDIEIKLADFPRSAGDEFFTKPINLQNFIPLVRNRAERYRHVKQTYQEMQQYVNDGKFQQYVLDQHAIVSATDSQGLITYVNNTFCEVSGYSSTELLGQNHRLIKSNIHSDKFYAEMWQTISSGKTWQGEVCNRKKNGELYWVESTIVPQLDENDLPIKYISVRTEITNVKKTERLYKEQSNELQVILDSTPTIVLYLDKNSIIRKANHAASQLLKFDSNELEGKSLIDLVAHSAQFFNINSEVLRNQHQRLGSIERLVFPDGEYDLKIDRIPHLDSNDNVIGIIIFAENFTEHLANQRALMESEERLRRSQDFARIGTWDWDIKTGNLAWSDLIGPLFGYGENKPETTYENFLAAIHPDDKQSVIDAIEQCSKYGVPYDIEHRVVWQDGSVHWVQEKGDIVRNGDGEPIRMLGSVQDITARREYQDQLRDARREAENANSAKTEFLFNMSHEVRTPLNAIMGFGQLLQTDENIELNDEGRSHVEQIMQAGEHLLTLINELLDLAKIESGNLQLNIESTSIKNIVEEVENLIRPLAVKHHITYDFEKALRHTAVLADRTRLKQVLLNYISNAIKYNKANGNVRLETEIRGQFIRFWIRDTGMGISHDQIENLYKPFDRLNAENSNIEGTGIGLAITKKLIEGMNGQVGVNSILGMGTNFWFELPMPLRSSENSETETSPAKKNKKQSTYTVLYIEDNQANIRLVDQLIRRHSNVNLIYSTSALSGIELAVSEHPDLILMDINLPGMNGFSALENLRSCNDTKEIPVVAISANATQYDIDKGLNSGFNAYLTKPLDIHKFYNTLDYYL